MSRKQIQRLALCGLMTALMLVLGYVESLLPLPGGLPGMKLGLANSVLLYALYMLSAPAALLLMLLKALLSALLFGGLSTLPFSLSGGALSLAGMLLCRRIPGIGPMAVSAVGGMLHNVGQVLMAMLLLKTAGLMGYMALLMAVGLFTGLITGLIAQLTMRHLRLLPR